MAAGVRLLALLTAALTWHAVPGAPVEIGSFAPASAPSAEIENLTARSFADKVIKPVNSTAYLAMVLFHRNQHQVLEHFLTAKQKLEQGVRTREIQLFRPIRFFIMDCTTQDNVDICWRYSGGRLPCLLNFRGEYTLRFKKTFYEEGMSYWIARATRSAYLYVERKESWFAQEKMQNVPCFLLIMKYANPELLSAYENLAMELREYQNFHVAADGDEWRDLPGPRPSMHFLANKELYLDAPPPFDLSFDQDSLRSWVIISSMPHLGQVNFYLWELIPADWTVVVLRHHGDQSAVDRFKDHTQAMRAAMRFSFAHLDVSTEVGIQFARTFFPLVAPQWEDYIPFFTNVQAPRVFVFTKLQYDDVRYWDADFPSPEEFQLEDVDKLMRNTIALEPSDFHYWMGWFLRFDRFGSRSWFHRLIWLGAILLSSYSAIYFCLIAREIHNQLRFEESSNIQAPEKVKKPKKGKKSR